MEYLCHLFFNLSILKICIPVWVDIDRHSSLLQVDLVVDFSGEQQLIKVSEKLRKFSQELLYLWPGGSCVSFNSKQQANSI